MQPLLLSQTAVFAAGYFAIALLASHYLREPQFRAGAFATINIVAVWLIFFGPDAGGAGQMAIYLLLVCGFWILLHRYGAHPALWLAAFLPPIILLVFAKLTNVLLLIGISYMSFRLAHMVWEIQLRRIEPMPLPEFLAHSFFVPTFLMGPISPYSYFASSFLAGKTIEIKVSECALRILKGAVKAFVIGPIFLQLTPMNYLGDTRMHQAFEFPIAAVAFYLYLYANFSGLNDISIGAARLMGVRVMENFDRPYLADGLTAFWTRWHASLSQWLRDIVFGPLTTYLLRNARFIGAQHSVAIALMTTFVLIGWWHGNGIQFILMGIGFGAGVVIEHYFGLFVRRWPSKLRQTWNNSASLRATRIVCTNLYVAMVVSLMGIDIDRLGGLAFVFSYGKRLLGF